MNRRRFLTFAASTSTLLLMGCRRSLSTQPELPNPEKVRIERPPGEGGGGDTPIVILTVMVGTATRSISVPRSPTMTVGQVLDWAKAHAGLDVEFGFDPTKPARGRYVNHLLGTTVNASSVPTLLYAVGTGFFSTEDDWYNGLAGSYVDLQSAPTAGGVIDWRLATP
jgi:hypothetical protein